MDTDWYPHRRIYVLCRPSSYCMMATAKTDVTEAEQDTYTSSSLSKFAWQSDPFGERGFLHVVFRSGERYVYIGVSEDTAEELRSRAHNPSEHGSSVGEFFHAKIRNEFKRKNEDYQHL